MSDHDTQDVSGCLPCPYSEWEYVDCHHPAHGKGTPRTLTGLPNKYDYDDPDSAPTPPWCPLRTRPVLVRLRGANPVMVTAHEYARSHGWRIADFDGFSRANDAIRGVRIMLDAHVDGRWYAGQVTIRESGFSIDRTVYPDGNGTAANVLDAMIAADKWLAAKESR